MHKARKPYIALAALLPLLSGSPALAVTDQDIETLKKEIQEMRRAYEGRIAELENKLQAMESSRQQAAATKTEERPAIFSGRNVYSNDLNPSIGVILNGKYASYSLGTSEIPGFGIGEEGERGKEGLAIDESELNFAASVDDKFAGSLTAALVREGGNDKVELEEAYVHTLAGLGLPKGLSAKAGRAFWTLGYLNEHHTHADDFADRPLPYRAFLNKAYNDDGLEVSYILPVDLYSEIGGGLFRGDDFPAGGADGDEADAWSAFARIGGDLGADISWRLGGYLLDGETDGGRTTNENTVTFLGDSDLYAADLRCTWAPTGNAREQEVILQGEYFRREETGSYADTNAGTGTVAFDDDAGGWYAQAVYKFLPQWRAGARYSRLESPGVPAGLAGSALDSRGHDPAASALMLDWTNSEFSRLRLQYNHEELSSRQNDDQILLQYLMSFGAHGAHKF